MFRWQVFEIGIVLPDSGQQFQPILLRAVGKTCSGLNKSRRSGFADQFEQSGKVRQKHGKRVVLRGRKLLIDLFLEARHSPIESEKLRDGGVVLGQLARSRDTAVPGKLGHSPPRPYSRAFFVSHSGGRLLPRLCYAPLPPSSYAR